MKNYNKSYIGLRKDLLEYIQGDFNTILDVGCATGSNGRYLLQNNLAKEVIGIEYDDSMAQIASNCISKVFCGDLNNREFLENIINKKYNFDYIIFGDVLEHLYNPKKVLVLLKSMLKSNGRIIISIPNIGHIELFIQVFIKGTFPTNERGIFDKTHLRWFTKKDLFDLVKMSNLEVINYKGKLRARDAKGSKFNLGTKILKWINKDLVTHQHIVVCKHA